MKILKKLILSAFAILAAANVYAATGFKTDSYGNIKGGRSSVILGDGDAVNCRLLISGSTLSVVGTNGDALSADNPCTIRVRNTTGGVSTVKSFESPVSVTFGSSSDTDGNDWGLSAGVDWSERMLFAVGVVTNDTDYYFVIGRRIRVATGGAAGDLCQKGDTDCDAFDDQMILSTGLTLSNWTNKPMTPVAVMGATYATSGAAWTFNIAADYIEGFNTQKFIGKRYIYPAGQNGNTANYYWSGTTPPTWATPANISSTYWFTSWFNVCWEMTTTSAGNASNGTGANTITLGPPMPVVHGTGSSTWWPIGSFQAAGSTAVNGVLMGLTNATSDSSIVLYEQGLSTLAANEFSNTADDITVQMCWALQ